MSLPTKQFELLYMLASNQGKIFTRDLGGFFAGTAPKYATAFPISALFHLKKSRLILPAGFFLLIIGR
ncbi:hypothetical protein [Bacillus salipaludis]|uniref:hypothetical protein n=1 Tax=Bacillus salipaludis TaxID=2547811 RepID=UPI002E1E4817|nr:hypothetical protein [Bacillus salipaludis]